MKVLVLKKLIPKIGGIALKKIYQFLGICPISLDQYFRARQSRFLTRYSVFLTICLILFLCSLYFEKENFISIQKSDVGSTVNFIQLVSMRLSSVIIIVEAMITRRHMISFYNNLYDVDRLLAQINVKTDFNVEQLKDLIKIFLAITTFVCSELMVVLMYKLRNTFETFTYWISYIPFYLHCCMRYLQLMQFITMTKRRIDIVNEKLREINVMRTSSLNTLDYLRDISYKVFMMSVSVNRAFGFSTLINIMNDFITITLNTYFIFVAFQEFTYKSKIKAAESIFWVTPHCFNVIFLSTCCQLTMINANKIGLLLHRIKFNCVSEEQNQFISQFSIQLLVQKVKFYAFGFFAIDFSLLYAIAATVTTYLVILIQFYLNEKNKGIETNYD